MTIMGDWAVLPFLAGVVPSSSEIPDFQGASQLLLVVNFGLNASSLPHFLVAQFLDHGCSSSLSQPQPPPPSEASQSLDPASVPALNCTIASRRNHLLTPAHIPDASEPKIEVPGATVGVKSAHRGQSSVGCCLPVDTFCAPD